MLDDARRCAECSDAAHLLRVGDGDEEVLVRIQPGAGELVTEDVLEPVREPLTDATQPAAEAVTQRVPTTI